MANPGGTNQFQKEPAYGAVKQLETLRKSAVMAGAQGATSAIETPRRSKRRAVRGQSGQEQRAGSEPTRQPQPEQPQAGGVELPYPVRLAAAWAEIAAHPDASPLVRKYAEQAMGAIREEVA
jgi:hypothetical protein